MCKRASQENDYVVQNYLNELIFTIFEIRVWQ